MTSRTVVDVTVALNLHLTNFQL